MIPVIKDGLVTTILVVDDIADNLRLLAKILENQGYQVLKALTGKMALQAIQRNPPHLILLDINMPEMNGFEICQQLRTTEATAAIPIIFISALDQVHEKVRAFELGGQDYITKPFQELEVLARVKNQLLIRQQQQQLQREIQIRQQAESEAQRLNLHLERQIQSRTLELQQALSCEWALKHVSDQVRDSLDQHRIMQTTVETLAWALEGHCCDAALYSPDHTTSTIRYQWTEPGLANTQGQTLYVTDFPELYEQLQARVCFAFCQIEPSPIRHQSAVLACPIFDDSVGETGILGDLWLFRETHSSFGEAEVRLVQQVANQCAIALRQARLYAAAQAQVQELERLNQLKDDFLSTISHELRTPIASMKMMINLINTVMGSPPSAAAIAPGEVRQDPKLLQYLEVLQRECDRELKLVEDLLNLQHAEAGTYATQAMAINLHDQLRHLIEPFETMTQNQQQQLQIDIAEALPTLYMDPFVINRVVTELLSNAYKYTPAGGKITIAAQVLPATDAATQNYLEITVTNTGIEIAPEEQSRVFDKFYRIPNHDPWKHSGTGLGLALIKKLVEQMNGTIAVASAHLQTQFVLRFGVSPAPRIK
jgi:signal transduction histidine kinase/DNA-binding response OmpR family regulator